MNYKIRKNVRKLIDYVYDLPIYIIKSFLYVLSKKRYHFENQLSICSIAKNETEYINEWIEHHLLLGFEKIYLYDNDSTDDLYGCVKKYIDSKKVVYTKISGNNKQFAAYNDAIKKYKNKTKYMLFIDCDEFLMPCKKGENINKIIDEIFDETFGGLAINWRMYGSSGHDKKPCGNVLESYLYRANECGPGNDCIKTLTNPRKVFKFYHAHYPRYLLGFHNFNENKIAVKNAYNIVPNLNYLRINHYFTKSKEEWITRRSLGKADTRYVKDNVRSMEEFYLHDNNQIYDDIGLFYNNIRNTKDWRK